MTPQGAIAMELPWLSPCAASLVALALARAPTSAAWCDVRTDPGCVLLVVRHTPAARTSPGLSCYARALAEPAILEAARAQLERGADGFVDWNEPELLPVYQACVTYARVAEHLARHSDICDRDNAWVGGLLAPLGWLAHATQFENLRTARSANRPGEPVDPQSLSALARRLAHRWQLPNWLAAITGHLGLPVTTAQTLGADPTLFRVVQLAVALTQDKGHGLDLPVGGSTVELSAALGLGPGDLEAAWHDAVAALPRQTSPASWEAPARMPLLPELLRLAVEKRRLEKTALVEQLEQDLDALHRAVAEQQRGEAERLERRKLEALAELAAGAGHEINNPLAVISGQAQYLLGHEMDPARRRSLQTIVNQAQRIHQTLTDLMQFARPLPPRRQLVDISRLLREVSLSLQGLAADRQVRLTSGEPAPEAHHVHADPNQLQTALTCLVRNAIEAAPLDGWAGVRVEAAADDLAFIIEDSGRGLTPADREHLFDPFYCGRKAGRGRGLGLSTAWRFAQLHGGDVRYERPADGPTRFVLRLPATAPTASPVEPAPQRNGHLPTIAGTSSEHAA